MSPKKNPEGGNLGAEDDDAGSEIDVSMLPQLSEAHAARLTRTPPEVAARRRWAYSLIRRAATPVPSYGSPEWLQLPDGSAEKVASVVVAAEAWAREVDDLPDRLEHELDERRRAEKAAEDAEYQARAAAHRRDWRHLRVVEPYADRRARELAEARQGSADASRGGELA